MINPTPDSLATSAVSFLRLEPPPKEAEIDEVLDKLAIAFGASAEVTKSARNLLHARFQIYMDLGETLTGSDEHVAWLRARQSQIVPFYWRRYRDFLINSGWAPLVTSTLDQTTDTVLDLLGNPRDSAPWKRRGLVVGDVQSGKTASYTGLICKAADAGYRMVILLTGTLENVRRQTQERLDEGFIGFDSREYLGGTQLQHKRHIGVGRLNHERDGVVFTSRDHDFRKSSASALNIALDAVREPVLVVTKKNKAVLERLASWLRSKNINAEGKIDLPLLLIDDEADNASINTKKDPSKTTAINGAIRDLLELFKRSSYVGFTATPFANIFIDPASTSEMLGADLFPRDFIHLLEPPTNYIGMHTLFPQIDPEESNVSSESTACLREIDDDAAWLPLDHDKDASPGPLPASLRCAVYSFLIACTVRDLRACRGEIGGGGGIHRSMLINVSRFTAVQNKITNIIHLALDDVRSAVRLYGKLSPAAANLSSSAIADLQAVFDQDFSACGFEWSDLLGALWESISPIQVQSVNQSRKSVALDYGIIKEFPGVRVIVVGGNSLSRGLTLEGLSTSYFIRNSKGYDTLLQMGRWFGYRTGYENVCRLWLTDEAERWYRHISTASAELKRDFGRMMRRKATPEEFGLRVRTHPDTLLITARNKMATGMDIEIAQEVSLTGMMIESARLYADRSRNADNFAFIEQFIRQLTGPFRQPEQSAHGGALLWKSVPAEKIADLLDSFLVHPINFDFQGDSIADFLRVGADGSNTDSQAWTVALFTRGEGGIVELESLPNIEIFAKSRGVKKSLGNSILVSGKGARVGSRLDIRHGLSPEECGELERRYIAAREASPNKAKLPADTPQDVYRAAMTNPLLLIYLIRGKDGENDYLGRITLPALALHFPGDKRGNGNRKVIKYRLNIVAQDALFEQGSIADDDEEEDEVDVDN